MSGAFEIAGVGMGAQQKALDAIANNVANINTAGFKRSDVRFSEAVARAMPEAVPSARLAPAGGSGGVFASSVFMLEDQGQIEQTGRMLDIAIDGDGFLELLGPDGSSLLWRGGTLQINPDGYLAGPGGFVLRDMVSIPLDAQSLSIDATGVVRAVTESDTAPIDIGGLSLVRLSGTDAVEPFGSGLYRLREGEHVTEVQPGEDGGGILVQGAIERSNVDLNTEMVRMIIVQRAYAANAQIVKTADELAALANNMAR